MIEEIWKSIQIEPFSKDYAVSNLGNIKRLRRGANNKPAITLRTFEDEAGYYYIVLSKTIKGKRIAKRFLIHRLVAFTFMGPCPLGKEVDHIDRDKGNNEELNLRYITHKDNIKHSWGHTLIP